jgi:GNAT superfamily N-acetyltransferase
MNATPGVGTATARPVRPASEPSLPGPTAEWAQSPFVASAALPQRTASAAPRAEVEEARWAAPQPAHRRLAEAGSVRVAGPRDRERVSQFWQSIGENAWRRRTHGGQPTSEGVQRMTDLTLRTPSVLFEEEGRVTGVVNVVPCEGRPRTAEMAIVVHPDAQGQRVGTTLLHAADVLAQHNGMTDMMATPYDRQVATMLHANGYRYDVRADEYRKALDRARL